MDHTHIEQRLLKRIVGALLVGGCLLLGTMAAQADDHEASQDTWLPTLVTETPQEGFALAVTLSQKAVATTQTDAETRKALRPEYAEDPDSLIAVSHVIATHFQTIAAANDYWRE
ncbi:hexameric tyrosine-coordinated heme protein [Halomonas sp. C05BenzN]|uniref:hexameric tyrosine-coordinated heme protein n=1 Tax=Halomonas sp. C05BenzN TaxID=3411041 RepID=UPI003B93AB53